MRHLSALQRPTVLLVGATAAALALRIAVTASSREPVLYPDEAAPLLIARLLVGHDPMPSMGNDAFYHAAYPLLLAPGTALLSAAGAWRAATVVNAALLAGLVLLVHAFARRVLDAPPRLALLTAIVVSLYPAFVLQAGLTWSESAVLPAVVLPIVLYRSLLDRRTTWAALAYGASAVAAYAVHARLLPVVLLAPLALWLARRRAGVSTRAVVSGVLVIVVGTIAVRVLHAWMRESLYLDAPGSDEQEVVGRIFRDPVNALRALAALVGQSWYLTVATFGLAPLGAWTLAREVVARRRLDLLLASVTIGTLLAVSSLFVIDPERVDQRVYGRYAETFVALLLTAGVVAIVRGVRRPAWAELACLVGAPVVLAAALVVGVGTEDLRGLLNPLNLLGIAHFVQLEQRVDVVAITGWAVLGGAALLALRALPWHRSRDVVLLGLGAAFVASFVHTDRTVIEPIHEARRVRSALPSVVREVEQLSGVAIRRVDIEYEVGVDGGTFFGYQLALPDVDFDAWDPGAMPVPRGPWVLTDKVWPAGEEAGARLVVPERLAGTALWVLPSAEQDRLDARGFLSPDGPLSDRDLDATVTSSRRSASLSLGGRNEDVVINVTHRGHRPWPSALDRIDDPVRLHASWVPEGGGAVAWRSVADLPHRLYPGSDAEVTLRLQTRADDGAEVPPGRYRLQWSLVQEHGIEAVVDGDDLTVEVR